MTAWPLSPWIIARSAALHAAVLFLLLPAAARHSDQSIEQPPIEVELISQVAMNPGDTPSPQQVAAVKTAAPQPATQPFSPSSQPVLAPSFQSGTHTTPAVNLGDGANLLDALTVTGTHVVPPSPNSYRNQPPHYPADAARRGIEGTVGLVIHVSAGGIAERVEVVNSSGTDSLDRAAAERLSSWRFTPARDGDRSIPFDYEMNIRFVLGDHP